MGGAQLRRGKLFAFAAAGKRNAGSGIAANPSKAQIER
jgi:hypothetical protein